MAIDHTLTPAEIVARCEVLGCTIDTLNGKYKITPPSGATTPDGSRPSLVHITVSADFRSRSDRSHVIRNLRNNGVDVLADRDWSGGNDAVAVNGTPQIPKLTVAGPRPVNTWTKSATPDPEPEPGELVEVRDRLAAAERSAKAALEGLKHANETAAQLTSRIEQLAGAITEGRDRSNRDAARARDAVRDLHDRIDELADLVTAPQPPAAPVAAAEPSRVDVLADAVVNSSALAAVPDTVWLARSSIGDTIGIASTEDLASLSLALNRLHGEGRMARTGKSAATRWRLIKQQDGEQS